jgi:hypothetical protein
MSFYILFVYFVLIGTASVRAVQPRSYINPLNSNLLDVFFLVDESNTFLNVLQLGQLKIALNATVVSLNPPGSSPYFGASFYGATTTVQSIVPFPTTSAALFGSLISQKPFIASQQGASTLVSALNSVDSLCKVKCRSNAPRVTVVFSGVLDSSAEARIRQLENELTMTVIIIGVGRNVNLAVLNRLASYPSHLYGILFDSFTELIVSATYISSLITSISRSLPASTSLAISTTSGPYYTLQFNSYAFTQTKDAIVAVTANANGPIYVSLSEPNPVASNTGATYYHNIYTTFSSRMWYFHIPRYTKRVFFSLQGVAPTTVYIEYFIFPLPNIMPNLVAYNASLDLSQSLG